MGIMRATLKGTMWGQTINVVTGWSLVGPLTSAQCAQTADGVFNGWSGSFISHEVDDLSFTECEVVGVDDPTKFGVFSGSMTGAVTADPAPAFVVAKVKLDTGLRGRSYQGRFGIPGIPEGNTDAANGNQLAGASQTVFNNDLAAFIFHVESNGATPQLSVVSQYSGVDPITHQPIPRVTPIATPVTTASVMLALGSRISRKG